MSRVFFFFFFIFFFYQNFLKKKKNFFCLFVYIPGLIHNLHSCLLLAVDTSVI
jgi:hypothetical protein